MRRTRRKQEPLAINGGRASVTCVCGHITLQHDKGYGRCFNCPTRGKERCTVFRPEGGGQR